MRTTRRAKRHATHLLLHLVSAVLGRLELVAKLEGLDLCLKLRQVCIKRLIGNEHCSTLRDSHHDGTDDLHEGWHFLQESAHGGEDELGESESARTDHHPGLPDAVPRCSDAKTHKAHIDFARKQGARSSGTQAHPDEAQDIGPPHGRWEEGGQRRTLVLCR